MPAQIETFLWCLQNEHFEMHMASDSNPETEYLVSFSRGNWHCECRGFKYHRTCKHIEVAETFKCDYGFEAVMGSPAHDWDDGNCPKCGSKATGVKVAV